MRKRIIAALCAILAVSFGFYMNYSLLAETNNNLIKADQPSITAQNEALGIAVIVNEKLTNDRFGGMYIDSNNILNVNFVDVQYSDIIKGKNVIIHEVKYTLSELKSAIDAANIYVLKNYIDCPCIYLDESINRVVIELNQRNNDLQVLSKRSDFLNTLGNSDIYEIRYIDGGYFLQEE